MAHVPTGYMTCDHCATRSDLYRAFPTCELCGDDVCPSCADAGTIRENVDTGVMTTCTCERCADDDRMSGPSGYDTAAADGEVD